MSAFNWWHRLKAYSIHILFSSALSRCKGTTLVCLAWLSSAVLYWVVSSFLARLVERKCYSYNLKTRSDHSSRQLLIQGHGSGTLSIRAGCWSCVFNLISLTVHSFTAVVVLSFHDWCECVNTQHYDTSVVHFSLGSKGVLNRIVPYCIAL